MVELLWSRSLRRVRWSSVVSCESLSLSWHSPILMFRRTQTVIPAQYSFWKEVRSYKHYMLIGSEREGHGVQIFDMTKVNLNPQSQLLPRSRVLTSWVASRHYWRWWASYLWWYCWGWCWKSFLRHDGWSKHAQRPRQVSTYNGPLTVFHATAISHLDNWWCIRASIFCHDLSHIC